MDLRNWREFHRLEKVVPSAQDVTILLAKIDEELRDASLENRAPSGRYDSAYNAVRRLCELALHACGFRDGGKEEHHAVVVQSLGFTLGMRKDDVERFQRFRKKRNMLQYDMWGQVSQTQADELLDAAKKLRVDVTDWLRRNHPELLK